MQMYDYLARNKDGQVVRGKASAANENELLHTLGEKGLLVISFEAPKARRASLATREIAIFKPRFKKRDLIVFTRQFATTIKAGIPAVNALRFLLQETQDKYFKVVLEKIVTSVEQGSSLSEAFRRFPDIFPEIYSEMVAAGEASGTLDEVLNNLSTTMEEDYRIYLEVKNALRYPILVLSAIFFSIFFITVFVVPRFAKVYSQFNMKLPFSTRLMIGASSFLVNNLIFVVIFGIISLFLFHHWRKTKSGKVIWGKIKLKIPIMGDISMKVSLLRFCFIFNSLNNAGIPILKVLEIVSKTLGNDYLKISITKFKDGVSEGNPLSTMIKKDDAFPKLVANMIGIGEQTGAIDVVLGSLSEYYKTEVKSKIDAMTVTIEPLLTGVLAVFVFILAMAVFLPMWNMVNVFKVAQ